MHATQHSQRCNEHVHPPYHRAIISLEFDYASILDFGGINTGDAEDAVRRADKGGMVTGPQLRGLVTLISGECCWEGCCVGACRCDAASLCSMLQAPVS